MKRVVDFGFYFMAGFYVFLMLDLFFRFFRFSSGLDEGYTYNLIPFKIIWGYVGGGISSSLAGIVQNVLGNILIFIPFGIYLQIFLKNKGVLRSFLICLGTSVSVEVVQFVSGRGFADVDDLILNGLGGIFGILGFKLLLRILGDGERVRRVVSVGSIVVGGAVFLVYFLPVIFIQ